MRTSAIKLLQWSMGAFVFYAVARLAIVTGVPAYYVRAEWVTSIVNKCGQKPEWCTRSTVRRAKVGRWWYGYAFHFTTYEGKSEIFRQFVVEDLPSTPGSNDLNRWSFVGIRVTEEEKVRR